MMNDINITSLVNRAPFAGYLDAAIWTEKLAGEPQAGISTPHPLARVMGVDNNNITSLL